MKKLLLLVSGVFVISCGPVGILPECPANTRPFVCHKIGLATCDNDRLEKVVGCYVQAGADLQLECVSECAF